MCINSKLQQLKRLIVSGLYRFTALSPIKWKIASFTQKITLWMACRCKVVCYVYQHANNIKQSVCFAAISQHPVWSFNSQCTQQPA